jgi:hypothetical protein
MLLRAFTLLAALGGVCVPFLAPRFSDSYNDFHVELPFLTALALRFYPLLILIACGLGCAAVRIAWRYQDGKSSERRLLAIFILLIGLQAGITVYALELPLFRLAGKITGGHS